MSAISIFKSAIFGGGVTGFFLFLASRILFGPLSWAAFFLRIGIGFFYSGIISAGIAKFLNNLRQKQFEAQIREDKAKSEKFRTRKILLKYVLADHKISVSNQNDSESNQKALFDLPIEKCRLLGLNPILVRSHDDLKSAYLNMLKKYHPDVWRGDKQVGEAMTKQIIHAYRELSAIINKKI